MTIQKVGGRGRPRSFDADEAVAVAERMFRERGYDGVGVADIGKALGITPPSFYAAFGSKLGLFERVIDRYQAGDAAFLPAALATPGSAVAAIGRLFEDAARSYAKRGDIAGCLVLDGARNSGDAQAVALTAALRDASVAAVAERIAADRPEEAGRLARMVMIALRGMSAAARDGASEDDLVAFARAASRAFAQESEA